MMTNCTSKVLARHLAACEDATKSGALRMSESLAAFPILSFREFGQFEILNFEFVCPPPLLEPQIIAGTKARPAVSRHIALPVIMQAVVILGVLSLSAESRSVLKFANDLEVPALYSTTSLSVVGADAQAGQIQSTKFSSSETVSADSMRNSGLSIASQGISVANIEGPGKHKAIEIRGELNVTGEVIYTSAPPPQSFLEVSSGHRSRSDWVLQKHFYGFDSDEGPERTITNLPEHSYLNIKAELLYSEAASMAAASRLQAVTAYCKVDGRYVWLKAIRPTALDSASEESMSHFLRVDSKVPHSSAAARVEFGVSPASAAAHRPDEVELRAGAGRRAGDGELTENDAKRKKQARRLLQLNNVEIYVKRI
eukprot:jgi/Bigna1/81113/fgenesh1_pg.77_\